MRTLFLILASFFAGLWWSERQKQPTVQIHYHTNDTPTSAAPPTPQKSRTAEEMSPTYKAYRDWYLSRDFQPTGESAAKHNRRFEKILGELDLQNLSEMEASNIKKMFKDLFRSATHEIKKLIENYNIPEFQEEEEQ